MESLGVTDVTLAGLASVSTQNLLDALAHIKQAGRFRTLAPVIDGHSLKRHPFDPDAPAVSARVPLMIGSTATETTLLLGFDDSLFTLDWADLPGKLLPHVGSDKAPEIVQRYRALYPEATASDVFFKVTTRVLMTRNAMQIANLKATQGGAPVYVYELIFATAVDGGKWRSPHTLDIPLVFDNVAFSASLLGDTPDVQQVADQMSSAWLAFARAGNPNTPGLPEWPPFDAGRAAMRFNLESVVEWDPFEAEEEILQAVPLWDMTQPQKF